MNEITKGLFKELKRDEFLKKVKKRLEKLPKIDIEDLETEIKLIHKTKTSRKLKITKYSVAELNEILKTILENQTNRSRLSEILINLRSLYNQIYFLLELAENYITTNFPIDYLSSYKSEKSKVAILKLFFSKYYEYLEELDRIISISEIAIEDIDKIHFDLDTVAKIFEKMLSMEKA